MNFWDKLKDGIKKGTEQFAGATEELIEKGQKAGDEGLEAIREVITQIGGKTSDMTSALQLKFDVDALQKRFKAETLSLGNLILKNQKSAKPNEEAIVHKLKEMLELDKQIQTRKQEYMHFRKTISKDYAIDKLQDDLTASGIIIKQVIVSEKSNVVNKLLKELLLPKEALISAIKRGEEVIIPDGNSQIYAGDLVTVLGKENDVAKISKRLKAV